MKNQDVSAIKSHMPVLGSDNVMLGTVDQLDAHQMVKLTKDTQGHHHWIPLAWVSEVKAEVRLDRSSQRAQQAWATTPRGARE